MSEVYYFGSEKISPLTVQVDFHDGILKKVVCKEDPIEEKESVSTKDKSPTKDDSKKPGIIVFDDAAKKLHLDLNNSPLKIGNDDTLTNTLPEKVEINFTSVKCGMRYAIFQDEAGKLYSCGYGNMGELGLGKEKTYTKLPTLIDGLEYKKIVRYECGPNHAVAFSTENKMYSWGDGSFGRQGVSASTSVFRPQIITFSKNELKTSTTTTIPTQEDESPVREFLRKNHPPDFKWIDVACGGDFSIFASEQGMFGLGRETNGRLGVGAIFESTYVPLPITYFQKIKIMGIASGKSHSVAWDSEGHAYSWGDGSEGKLGHSIDKGFHMSKFEIYPKRIVALEKYRILLMACGTSHSCALTNKGEIFTWGRTASNTKGEKASYKLLEYFSPRKLTVHSPSSNNDEPVFVKISCGPTHNAALDKDYNLYTWGDGSENCLGFPATDDVVIPTLVERVSKYKVIDVGCGDNFTFIIACNRDKNFPSKALKSFQEGYLEHMRNTIQNIQDWRKKKVLSDMKVSSFNNNNKQSATLPYPDHQNSLMDSGINKTSSFAATSNTPFLKSYSPSNMHLLEKVTTPKRPSKKEINSASKLPFIMEASQKISDIIDASSKHPRSPTLPTVGKRNHLSEILMSEPSKNAFSPHSPKFKLNFPTEETRKKTDETITLNTVRSAFLPIIFNPTEESYKTQPNEAEDFETIFGKKGNAEEYDVISEPHEDQIKDMMAKNAEQKVQTKNTRVTKSLYEELDTNDDQLKYEYIQMVKSGKEQEHMLYLLQDPESRTAFTEASMKHERMKMRHQQETHQEDLKARVLIDTAKKAKETLVGKALPLTSDLIYQINGVYNYTKHFLDEKMDARKLSPDQSNIQPVTIVTQEDIIRRGAENKQRTLKVLQKKKEIEKNKKQQLYEKFNKRTEEYKEALRLEKIERQKKSECLKKFSSYFMFETMLETMRAAADRGLDIKRKEFLYSMKARLIQNKFKKYTIVKKVKMLSAKQNKKLREMVRNYLMNKKVRKIVLLHLRLKLEFKIKASLLLFKTKMSNIKSFLMWTHKKMEAYRYKLTLEWDNHIINNFKLKADPQVGIGISDSPLAMSRFKSSIESPKVSDASPTREVQSNQIEDFVRRSTRNFRKFMSLQSEGDVRGPLKLNPSILPTTYELHVDIEFEADTNDHVKSTKKNKIDLMKGNPFERAESKLKNFSNLLLPFSYHYCKAMSILYRINHDTSSPFKDLLFERSVEFEAHLKYEFINKILKECLMKHDADLKEYRRKLMAFKRESNVEINLYRTKKMLNTPVTRLKALQKKEEYQLKRRAAERLSGKKVSQGLRSRELDDYQRDHLPFGTMLLKIAAVMPKAPKMPTLQISLKPHEFNAYFMRYYEAFKARYTHMVAEEREKLFKRKL